MMPETAENKTIEVYRCVEFPYRWELAVTLMTNVNAVDATLVEHENRWWLFVNICENKALQRMTSYFCSLPSTLYPQSGNRIRKTRSFRMCAGRGQRGPFCDVELNLSALAKTVRIATDEH